MGVADNIGSMPDEQGRSIIDPDNYERAVEGLGDHAHVERWARHFAVLADPSRLRLLVCIHYAGQICVSDLARAAGMSDTAVSQALRLLRAHELVTTSRSGRVVHYELADETVHDLIHHVRPHAEHQR